jgi:myo-inositol-1(or 4)-monophosphatase
MYAAEKALMAAQKAARAAGAILRERFDSPRQITAKETAIDIVTEVDLASEEVCRKILGESYPADFLGEEGGGSAPQDETPLWVVDPLDGTVNYAHQFPFFVVSIALCIGREPVVGVVYDPMRDEMFQAVKNRGAFLNERPIAVSSIDTLQASLLATGFPYDRQISDDDNLAHHRAFTKLTQGIRRAGAAALDLCYVAAGRLDGYWEKKLKPWDLAAGILLVREAGGVVTDYKNQPSDPFTLEAVASNQLLHASMIEVIGSV